MTKAIELIAKERQEQIEKHGYTQQEDASRYDEDNSENYAEPSQLIDAAIASIYGVKKEFPISWVESPFVDKICHKNYRERLVIAGALIAAEIDRHIAKWG
jgi:hypothetical protein